MMSPYLCHCSQDERSYLACSQDESIFASLFASLLSLRLSIMNALQFELSNRTGSLTYVRLKCKQTYSKLLYAQLFFFRRIMNSHTLDSSFFRTAQVCCEKIKIYLDKFRPIDVTQSSHLEDKIHNYVLHGNAGFFIPHNKIIGPVVCDKLKRCHAKKGLLEAFALKLTLCSLVCIYEHFSSSSEHRWPLLFRYTRQFYNLLKQCAAVTIQEGLMMVPPQASFVPLNNRATIQGQELGTLSRPPTILRKRPRFSYNRVRLPQSPETNQNQNVPVVISWHQTLLLCHSK